MTKHVSTAIRGKIVETLSSNGVTLENKTFHTPLPSPPLKVEVFSTGSSNSGITWHGGDRGGKNLLSLF